MYRTASLRLSPSASNSAPTCTCKLCLGFHIFSTLRLPQPQCGLGSQSPQNQWQEGWLGVLSSSFVDSIGFRVFWDVSKFGVPISTHENINCRVLPSSEFSALESHHLQGSVPFTIQTTPAVVWSTGIHGKSLSK